MVLGDVGAAPGEHAVHGLSRGLEGGKLEVGSMGFEIFLAAFGKGEGRDIVRTKRGACQWCVVCAARERRVVSLR